VTIGQPDLSPEEIGRIVNFLGYGSPSAPVWFMGIEEGLGNMNSQDISQNLKARATFESTMDLREAHIRLRERGRPIDIGPFAGTEQSLLQLGPFAGTGRPRVYQPRRNVFICRG
jgi:hypothetical protein